MTRTEKLQSFIDQEGDCGGVPCTSCPLHHICGTTDNLLDFATEAQRLLDLEQLGTSEAHARLKDMMSWPLEGHVEDELREIIKLMESN